MKCCKLVICVINKKSCALAASALEAREAYQSLQHLSISNRLKAHGIIPTNASNFNAAAHDRLSLSDPALSGCFRIGALLIQPRFQMMPLFI